MVDLVTNSDPRQSAWRRMVGDFRRWAKRVRLTRRLAMALTVVALIAGIVTVVVLTRSGPAGPSPLTVLMLLNIDLVVLLTLSVVVVRHITLLWAERRRGGEGSKLHVRFVVLFSGVAVAPAILVAAFSVTFFNIGLEAWFSARVRTALDESLAVAEAYLYEHRQTITNDVKAMAEHLNVAYDHALQDRSTLASLLISQATLRGLTEAVVFDGNGRVVARTGYTFSLNFVQVPFWAIEQANAGRVTVITGDSDDRVRALVKMSESEPLYLYAGRFVDARVLGHTQRTQTAVHQYQLLEGRKSRIQITFSLIFIVVALLLLLAAVWLGLTMARRLASPLMALIDAADRVRAGDLGTQVRERPTNDEFALLTRSFNLMMVQIAAQQGDLLIANRELDERRRFTEAVLAGVSAGVIGLDKEARIHLPNPSASELLVRELDTMIGEPVVTLLPALADMLTAVRNRPDRLIEREVHVTVAGRSRTLLVRLGGEQLGSELIGFVVTFDDITALQSAQRTAAWADVARRIAHEIKNPLTPIQLSAERLKRKYLKEIASDRETFVSCTDTIVRQVEDIRRMVDEFSEFARMPAPVLADADLRHLVERAVVLQRTAYPSLFFDVTLPDEPVIQCCDSRQIGQVLTNLVKNAVEAINGRRSAGEGGTFPPGRIEITIGDDSTGVCIYVADNGIGLPVDQRDRLTEPYVTTRAKGTGLGLAIVKKIMDDHGGNLVLGDRVGGGAVVTLIFPHEGGAISASPVSELLESKAVHGP